MIRVVMISLFFCIGGLFSEEAEILNLDIISYQQILNNEPEALKTLHSALHEKGIVGIRGISGYKEKVERFISASRDFHSLPEEVKEKYKPDHEKGETFLGYEYGKEKFQRADGEWVVDNLKTSYYAYIPDQPENKWPTELDLQKDYESLGEVMREVGELILYKIGILGDATGLFLEDNACLGRMLYYRKNSEEGNPQWCGAHFDHGLFTALIPATYYLHGKQVDEPVEAGLFIRTSPDAPYKKVMANDPDVLMFQVGEFGQLATDDGIRATEHLVHKADGPIERYTLAVFFNAPMDVPIYSHSVLTQDPRYGGKAGDPCTYRHWDHESFKRYIVEEKEE